MVDAVNLLHRSRITLTMRHTDRIASNVLLSGFEGNIQPRELSCPRPRPRADNAQTEK